MQVQLFSMPEVDKIKVTSRYKRYLLLCLLLIMALVVMLSSSAGGEAFESPANLLDLCHAFNALNTGVRDITIKKSAAKERFSELIKAVRKEYLAAGNKEFPVSDWVFPLKGYDYRAIGGVRGNGYQKGGYNYFDGNGHTGHPSQDIFIRDKRQNCLDDVTNKPVAVLALTGGVVVAAEKDWDKSSSLRGGKYIWIYDPASNALIYYAHNSRLHVAVGDIVKPGDVIADVGRTGLNAHKRRSPTHLHLTYLSIVNELPVPKNIYKELLKSKLM